MRFFIPALTAVLIFFAFPAAGMDANGGTGYKVRSQDAGRNNDYLPGWINGPEGAGMNARENNISACWQQAARITIGGTSASSGNQVVAGVPRDNTNNFDSYSEGSQGPRIEFSRTEIDFGKIPEGKKKYRHTFEFTNTGDRPLVITHTITSCKCVSVNTSRRPVEPGDTGTVVVTYDPKRQDGVFYKAVQVFTNCAEERHVLVVTGEVVPQDL